MYIINEHQLRKEENKKKTDREDTKSFTRTCTPNAFRVQGVFN